MNKPLILFVLLDEYADWEAASLSSALYDNTEGNYDVKTVSLATTPIRSIGGFTTVPDYAIDEAPTDFIGLILIGGNTWRNTASDQVKTLLDRAVENGAVIGAICDATTFLGKHGLLNNVLHTSNELEDLQTYAGNKYTNASNYKLLQSVRDRNIITANGTAFLEFTRDVLFALQAFFPESAYTEKEIIDNYNYDKYGYYEASKM